MCKSGPYDQRNSKQSLYDANGLPNDSETGPKLTQDDPRAALDKQNFAQERYLKNSRELATPPQMIRADTKAIARETYMTPRQPETGLSKGSRLFPRRRKTAPGRF